MKPSEYLEGNIARYIECDACGRITGSLWKAGKLCNNLIPTDGSRCQGILSQLREEEVWEIATGFKFERLSADEYRECEQAGMGMEIDIDYRSMVKAIGKPHVIGDEDFPDDYEGIGVCWGLRKPGTDDFIMLWNYSDEKPEESTCFFADYSSWSFFLDLMYYLDQQIGKRSGKT